MTRSKELSALLLAFGALFVLTACGDEVAEKSETTLENPVDTYMDSRVDAMQNAQSAVEESNKRAKAQEEAMDAVLK